MTMDRRGLMLGAMLGGAALVPPHAARAATPAGPARGPAPHLFSVRDFGAVGDGATIDSPAINKAIDHVAALGGEIRHAALLRIPAR